MRAEHLRHMCAERGDWEAVAAEVHSHPSEIEHVLTDDAQCEAVLRAVSTAPPGEVVVPYRVS
jgi:hypothetical protein